MTTTEPTKTVPAANRDRPANPQLDQIIKAINHRTFCTLATASATNRPHVAGVVYAAHDNALYVSTRRASRKARNIAENPQVFVCIPVRRLPIGPPSTVQLSATAEILAAEDIDIVRLAEAGHLKAITRHRELELPGGCFLRIRPAPKLHTYGLGLTLRPFIRDPLHAGGSVSAPPASGRAR